MILKFKQQTLTPYGFCKNGEELIVSIEKIEGNEVSLGIFNLNNLKERGNVSEFPNNKIILPFKEGDSLNYVSAFNRIASLLEIEGFLNPEGLIKGVDFKIMESLKFPSEINVKYSKRITIDKDYLFMTLRKYIDIEVEETKGNPFFKKEHYIVIYLENILDEHRVLFDNNDNVLIEENL